MTPKTYERKDTILTFAGCSPFVQLDKHLRGDVAHTAATAAFVPTQSLQRPFNTMCGEPRCKEHMHLDTHALGHWTHRLAPETDVSSNF